MSATLIDLFCGAGGLSLGFKNAGYELVYASDFDEAAVSTYQGYFGKHVYRRDLSQDVPNVLADVIAGGPPCQGFSSAGMRKTGDHRNNLVGRFAYIVSELRPRAFLFENVEGFLTAEEGVHVVELLGPLLKAGYRIQLRKINAANFGVPQHRKRVIAIGGLGWNPSFPTPTHSAYGAPGALLASRHLPLTPTLAEALSSLPPVGTEAPGNPDGHFYRQLSARELQRATALGPGMTMRDLPENFHHGSYHRRANRRVMDGTPTERRGGAPAGIRRLKADEPSKAITGGARTEFLHPTEHRNLTLRECARLQTFPDEFIFRGSQSEQAQLVGNAVPPQMAEVIARNLMNDVRRCQQTYDRGALLSFVPTLSEGASPVLQRVCAKVKESFSDYFEEQELSLWR